MSALVVSLPAPEFKPSQYHIDYAYGKQKENELEKKIETFFNDELFPSKNRFCPYDWQGKSGTFYELKSRTNELNKYPTTMIPAEKTRENTILLFAFIDGLYYIKYDEEQFSKFEKSSFRRWRTGICDKEKPYYYIPVNLLKPVS